MNHLLRAARIVPYGGGRARGPVAVNDTGLILASGQTADFDILGNDQRVDDEAQVRLVGGPTAPITARSIVNDRLQVTAASVGSNTAWSQTYEVETQFGISTAVASGMVQAAAATASIVYQWELHDGFLNAQVPATGGILGTQIGLVAFGQPTIPSTGGPANRGGVAMSGQQGFLTFDDPGAQNAPFQQQAFGISLYVQIGALAATGAPARKLIHKDNDSVQPPGGLAIEYANVGGINRLDPYMRDASGTVRRFNPPSPATARDITINQSFLVTFTYDSALSAGSRCKLYLYRRGETTTQNALVGTGLTDESAVTTGLLQNFETWVLGTNTQTVGGMTGALQRLIFWAGAPTKTQLDTLLSAPENNITIIYPQAPQPPIVNVDPLSISLSSTENEATLNPTTSATNGGNAITAVTSTHSNFTVTVQGDQKTIEVDRVGNGATTGTILYTLTNPGGSDTGTISVTVAAVVTGGVTPYPFVTAVRPTTSSTAKPGFNATAPKNTFVTDPVSGLKIYRVLPNPGTNMIDSSGTTTSWNCPALVRHHQSQVNCVWSATGKYLWIGQAHASTGSSSTINGNWPGGGVFLRSSDFRIHRFDHGFGGTSCWWDDLDDEKFWNVNSSGLYRSFNMTTGVTTTEFQISGYTFLNGTFESTSYSRYMFNGYQARGLARNSDGRRVAKRISLRDHGLGAGTGTNRGETSPDIEFPAGDPTPTITFPLSGNTTIGDGGHVTHRVSHSGNYITLLISPGDRCVSYRVPTGMGGVAANATLAQQQHSMAENPLGVSHWSHGLINGDDIIVGIGTGSPTIMTRHNVTTNTSRTLATIPSGGNPNTHCCTAVLDKFETYGAGTSGATSGFPRYDIVGKNGGHPGTGGMWAFRMGPNDTNVCRYLGHPQAEYAGDDDQQCDPNIDPTGRYIVFVSNWVYGTGGNGTTQPYIIELPPGWFSPTNSSTP